MPAIATRVADTAEFVLCMAGRLRRACRRRILSASGLMSAWNTQPLVRRMFEDLEWWLEGWEDPASRFFAALRQDRPRPGRSGGHPPHGGSGVPATGPGIRAPLPLRAARPT